MAGEGGGGGGLVPIVGGIISIVRGLRKRDYITPALAETAARKARGEIWRPAPGARWDVTLGRPWPGAWTPIVGRTFSPRPETGEPPGERRAPRSAGEPTRGGGLSPALYLSAAARIAAAVRARGGSAAPSVVYSQQRGAPPGTGSGVPGAPQAPPSQDPRVWADLVAYLVELFRKRPKTPGGDVLLFPYPYAEEVPSMAYQLSPYTGELIAGGLTGLGMAAGSIIGALRGVPAAMPGGAVIARGVGAVARQLPGVALGYGLGSAGGGGGVRGPSFFACEDPAGNTVMVRRAGTPLAWSGDVTAVKRLKRAQRTINRCIGTRRSGGRRRRMRGGY